MQRKAQNKERSMKQRNLWRFITIRGLFERQVSSDLFPLDKFFYIHFCHTVRLILVERDAVGIMACLSKKSAIVGLWKQPWVTVLFYFIILLFLRVIRTSRARHTARGAALSLIFTSLIVQNQVCQFFNSETCTLKPLKRRREARVSV